MLNRVFFAIALFSAVAPHYSANASEISGRVIDASGRPIADARVFTEEGIDGPIQETRTDAQGQYRITDVAAGITGVFAIAPGHAWGGQSVTLAHNEVRGGVDLRLGAPDTLAGEVLSVDGRGIGGANIVGVLLQTATPVAVPLGKLAHFGFTVPTTDPQGRFSVPSLPRGELVALKITHPRYAQEGAMDLPVGGTTQRIGMTPGVLVTGIVYARGTQTPVGNMTIMVRKSTPPADTVVTRTNADGSFAVRLKPGAYDFLAAGGDMRSPSGRRMEVTGDTPSQKVELYVAGTGRIAGQVRNAETDQPVANARVQIDAYGVPSAIVRTGPTGEFDVSVATGENTLRFESAPGYAPPPNPAYNINVTENETAKSPTFWVVPIPAYRVQAVDSAGNPVAGAAVRVLRPHQFGWRLTNNTGAADLTLASMPPDGIVVGTIEDGARGGIFVIPRTAGTTAKVVLEPLGRVTGRVTNEKGKAIAGAMVDVLLADARLPERPTVGRLTTDSKGDFSWPWATPGAPLQFAARAPMPNSAETTRGITPTVQITAGETARLQPLQLAGAGDASSVLGQSWKWGDYPALCGALPANVRGPALLVFTSGEEAPLIAESLAAVRAFAGPNLTTAVVTTETIPCAGIEGPVLEGIPPAPATTYLLDGAGRVVLETTGIPPAAAIASVARNN